MSSDKEGQHSTCTNTSGVQAFFITTHDIKLLVDRLPILLQMVGYGISQGKRKNDRIVGGIQELGYWTKPTSLQCTGES